MVEVIAFAFGGQEIAEKAGAAEIEGGISMTAGPLSEGTGQIGFTHPGGAADKQVVVFYEPVQVLQLDNFVFDQAAGMTVIDIFQAGRKNFEPCLGKHAGLFEVLAVKMLFVDQQADEILARQILMIRPVFFSTKALAMANNFKSSIFRTVSSVNMVKSLLGLILAFPA